MKTKRAAIYVRVSTNEQDTDAQVTELREYVENRGWSFTIYKDKGQSGAKNDRPALNAMLSDLRKRKADVVVVWALDRLARSLKHLLTIAEECRLPSCFEWTFFRIPKAGAEKSCARSPRSVKVDRWRRSGPMC